tara:strand:+ start:4914 stop:5177 length:264 start_codon:yes stop_codon:yes gene_type:complete
MTPGFLPKNIRLSLEQVDGADVAWTLLWVFCAVLLIVPAILWWRRRRRQRAKLMRMLNVVRQAAVADGQAGDVAILPLERKAKRMGM